MYMLNCVEAIRLSLQKCSAAFCPITNAAIDQNSESAFSAKQNFSTIDSITASRGIPYRFPMHQSRIVITGVGLTSPNGNSLEEYRKNLLDGVARIQMIDMRYMGAKGAIIQLTAGPNTVLLSLLVRLMPVLVQWLAADR